MNILVCISRVPDTASRIVVGSDRKTIDSSGLKYVVNPYDEFGIEEALQLKQKNGGEVTAITVGTPANTDVLRTALAMGVDKAVLIKGEDPADSSYVAENIAKYAKTYNPDLIFSR
jgi:electron transfer flavoprotein beta subunit